MSKSQEKSTNVRAVPRWLKRGLAALGTLSPVLAGRVAARLFMRAPRRWRGDAAQAARLAAATRFEVAHAGQHLVAWRWGAAGAPTVLLAHGWGGSAAQLTGLVGPLVHAGYQVVAFDAPGHGDSPGTHSSLPGFAAALTSVARVAGPLHAVVAHSMGGASTSLAIARGLRAGRAVFLAPPADARVWLHGFGKLLELDDAVLGAARRHLEAQLAIDFDDLTAPVLGPRLALPLLVLHDRGDREVPWRDGAETAARAPQAQLITTEGLGHKRILDSGQVQDEVVRFVSAAAPATVCSICGRTCEVPAGAGATPLCPRCELDLELGERERRWSQLGDHADHGALRAA